MFSHALLATWFAAASAPARSSVGCADTTHLWIPMTDSVALWRKRDSLDWRGPTYVAMKHELLLAKECAKGWRRVIVKDGSMHWAPQAKLVRYEPKAMAAAMDLGAGKIEGYLDNPQAVYILQEDANAMAGIDLERSFIGGSTGGAVDPTFGTSAGKPGSAPSPALEKRGAPAHREGGAQKSSGLRAGVTDDNQQFGAFLEFLGKQGATVQRVDADVQERLRIRVVDSKGRGIPDARILFSSKLDPRWDKQQVHMPDHALSVGGGSGSPIRTKVGVLFPDKNRLTDPERDGLLESGRTLANGTYWLYPSHWFQKAAFASLKIAGWNDTSFLVDRNGPREIEVRVPDSLRRTKDMPVDLVFVMDATSSMSSEIDRLKSAISILEMNLTSMPARPRLRFGLVQFRDSGDDFRVRKIPLTSDADSFAQALEKIEAGGGGDTPEDLQSALDTLVHGMEWSERGIRLAFVVTDAPPHLDYGQMFTYADAAHAARHKGIKIHTIGTGGLVLQGEVAMRQIAQTAGGKYVFLTYGERGESDGGHEASVSHHTGDNWVSEKLETALLRLAREEIARIADVPPVDSSGWFDAKRTSEDSRDTVLSELFRQATKELVDYSSGPLGDSQTVAVLPTVAELDTLKAAAKILEQNLTLSVSRSRNFRLVDRGNIGTVLREIAFQQSGAVDGSKVAETGRLLGAKHLIASGLVRRGDRYELFLKLLRVETGEVLSATRCRIDRKLVD